MRFGLILLFLPLYAIGACRLNEDRLQDQLFGQVRSLYGLAEDQEVRVQEHLSGKSVPEKGDVALLEFISEDRLFDRPKPKGSCPDRIIRIYQVYTRDEFRGCNGILRAEVVNGIYDLLYSNCVAD